MNMSLFNILGYASPIMMALLVAGAIAHSRHVAGNNSVNKVVLTWKTILLCIVHGLIAAIVYWHLITGGWLTEHYSWDDPDNINLVMAIFEAVTVATVIALLISRGRFIYRLLIDLMFIQILLAVVMGGLVLLFVLTWKPKMF